LARPIRPLAPRAGGSHLRGATALIAIAGLLIYTGSFAIGLGPVFWLLISEIYPAGAQARIAGGSRQLSPTPPL
jgi:hypothetical protein